MVARRRIRPIDKLPTRDAVVDPSLLPDDINELRARVAELEAENEKLTKELATSRKAESTIAKIAAALRNTEQKRKEQENAEKFMKLLGDYSDAEVRILATLGDAAAKSGIGFTSALQSFSQALSSATVSTEQLSSALTRAKYAGTVTGRSSSTHPFPVDMQSLPKKHNGIKLDSIAIDIESTAGIQIYENKHIPENTIVVGLPRYGKSHHAHLIENRFKRFAGSK